MPEEPQEILKIGSLWKRVSKNGKEYFGGSINFDVMIHANIFKRDSKDPDLIVFAKKRKKRKECNG